MTFIVDGAEVAGKRVPSSLKSDPRTGYWYSLDGGGTFDSPELREKATRLRISRYISAVSSQVLPKSYPSQVKGCANMVETLRSALDALQRDPGSQNIIVLFVTGVSNCITQAFYPEQPFPSATQIVSSVTEAIPPGSARVASGHRPVCFNWDPIFGTGFLKGGYYISQEQRLVLREAWVSIVDKLGGTEANSPGEALGDCLTMGAAA